MDADRLFADVPITRCATFWNTRPCNIRHSSKEVGTREYFDEVEQRKYFVEPHIPGLRSSRAGGRQRVLEIGCGIGTDTINFARAGAQVTAVELSEQSAAIWRGGGSRYSGSEIARSDPRRQRRRAPDTRPRQTFDLVYSFGVIHHSPHPRRIIEHVMRYMTPESELRLMVYARVSYKLFWIMKEEDIWDMSRIDELIARNSEAQTGCPVTYTYWRSNGA